MKNHLWLLLAFLVSGTTWLYMHRVLGPWEFYVNVERGTLKAALGDLYSPWVGTRELLLFGRNPYAPEVSNEIQTAFYGRTITQEYGKAGKPVDEQRFAYPVYVVFLMAPTMHLSFPQAQLWVQIALAILSAASILLWLDFLGWRPSATIIAAIILFAMSSPPCMQALRLRQLGLLVGFLLALSAWCIARSHLAMAGVLLAVSTIKPQMVILPLAWFLLWAASEWRTRWPLFIGFFAMLAALMGLGQFILPGWFHYFLQNIDAYRKYTYRTTLLELPLGPGLGTLCAAILLIGLAWFAWRNRKQAGDSHGFMLVLAATFVCAVLALPLISQFNQVMLFLPVLLLLSNWAVLPLAARCLFVTSLTWPWFVSLVLLFLPPDIHSVSKLPLLPAASAPFVPFVVALLLMVRQRPTNGSVSPVPVD